MSKSPATNSPVRSDYQSRLFRYEHAKRVRLQQEAQGCRMTESYSQFIKRITRELEV